MIPCVDNACSKSARSISASVFLSHIYGTRSATPPRSCTRVSVRGAVTSLHAACASHSEAATGLQSAHVLPLHSGRSFPRCNRKPYGAIPLFRLVSLRPHRVCRDQQHTFERRAAASRKRADSLPRHADDNRHFDKKISAVPDSLRPIHRCNESMASFGGARHLRSARLISQSTPCWLQPGHA